MSMPSGEEQYDSGEQLTLSDEGDELPWLESDDDYEEEGNDYRIVIFAVLAVLALAAILFGVNYLFGNRDNSAGEEIVADGSTIEAPDEPYKERPDDPGGSQVAGTGDVSFEVGQGQGREGQVSDDAPPPAGSSNNADSSSASSNASGVGVQVGAFQTRDAAQSGWRTLTGRFSALQGVNYRIIEGSVDSGTIYRLQAVASDLAAAESLCRSIRNGGGDCQVKR